MTPETLRHGAEALGGRIEGELGTDGERAVVVARVDPAAVGGRFLLEWVMGSRSALYLEEESRFLGGVAGWARPSIVAGDGSGLTAVAAEIERRGGAWERPGWWWRAWRSLRGRFAGDASTGVRPRGRLRVAVLLGSGELDGGSAGAGRLGADTLALFAHHGVRVITPGVLEV